MGNQTSSLLSQWEADMDSEKAKQMAGEIFDEYDLDGDGNMDQQEFENLLVGYAEMVADMARQRVGKKQNPQAHARIRAILKGFIRARSQRAAEMRKRFDADSDGKIDKAEFVTNIDREFVQIARELGEGLEAADVARTQSKCLRCLNDPCSFVVEVIRAEDVPKADLLSASDPYVELQLSEDLQGQRTKGVMGQTSVVRDAYHPVWYAYLNLKTQANPSDVLQIKLYDYEMVSKELLAVASVRVDTLSTEPSPVVLTKLKKKNVKKDCVLWLRVVPQDLPVQRKVVYFIRHGESEWNEAQERMNLRGMMAFDHPLNKLGVDQSKAFNAIWRARLAESLADPGNSGLRESERQFLEETQIVWTSPLTRAVQTCLLTMQGHPALAEDRPPVHLLRSCREIKGIGGLDTVGVAVGDQIIKRAQDKLAKTIGKAQAAQVCESVRVAPYTCETKWWTRGKDTQQSMSERYDRFWATVQHHPAQVQVVVGHSLFIREMCRRFIPKTRETAAAAPPEAKSDDTDPDDEDEDDGFIEIDDDSDDFDADLIEGDDEEEPSAAEVAAGDVLGNQQQQQQQRVLNSALCRDLKRFKLNNAACLRAVVDFSESKPVIVDVEMMFGTDVLRKKEEH